MVCGRKKWDVRPYVKSTRKLEVTFSAFRGLSDAENTLRHLGCEVNVSGFRHGRSGRESLTETHNLGHQSYSGNCLRWSDAEKTHIIVIFEDLGDLSKLLQGCLFASTEIHILLKGVSGYA